VLLELRLRAGERIPLSGIQQPVLVANGEADRMVPSSNSVDLARRLPNAQLTLYKDAGHGGIFQYHEEFVPRVLEFLESQNAHTPNKPPSCPIALSARIDPRALRRLSDAHRVRERPDAGGGP
jgi:hypothetical protein